MRKLITDQAALRRFQTSESYASLLHFLRLLTDSVVGQPLSSARAGSPLIADGVAMLDELHRWVEEIPPQKVAARYGNPAFKAWHARLCEQLAALMRSFLRGKLEEARLDATADELAEYLHASFGNATRIDYGTGHELSFLVWLYCLHRAGLLPHDDLQPAVLRLFARYVALMRTLQTTYLLEPAGSHGVWGLDDYHFLPFLFGAAQLARHEGMSPRVIVDVPRLEEEAEEYMYLAAVLFIRQVKKGPFHEHSPMLHDISHLESWERVATGLMRMYEGEVLGKFPVVQHLLFGTFLTGE